MTRERRAKYAGLLSELLVVFLGVLIALGADSFWEGREERNRIQTYLGAVAADLALARDQLQSSIQTNLEVLEQVRLDREFSVSGGEIPGDRVLRCCPGPAVATLPVGNLRALLETGDVNLLAPQSLRTALVTSYARLEQALTARTYYFQTTFDGYAELVAELDNERARLGLPEDPVPLREISGNRGLLAAHKKYWAALRELINQESQISWAIAEMHEAIAAESGISNVSLPGPTGMSPGEPVDLPVTVLEQYVGRYESSG